VIIIPASLPQDLPELVNIARKAFSVTPDSALENWFSFGEMEALVQQNRGICLKALSDKGEITGLTFAQQDSPVNGKESEEKWVIILAGVDPETTGQGVGSALLTELESQLKKRRVKKLFVYTNKGDEVVINFYRKNGYEDAGWIRDYQYGKGNSAVFLLKYL
jgi:ribosomal protein S18 acetylase RimI-like enzyme